MCTVLRHHGTTFTCILFYQVSVIKVRRALNGAGYSVTSRTVDPLQTAAGHDGGDAQRMSDELRPRHVAGGSTTFSQADTINPSTCLLVYAAVCIFYTCLLMLTSTVTWQRYYDTIHTGTARRDARAAPRF